MKYKDDFSCIVLLFSLTETHTCIIWFLILSTCAARAAVCDIFFLNFTEKKLFFKKDDMYSIRVVQAFIWCDKNDIEKVLHSFILIMVLLCSNSHRSENIQIHIVIKFSSIACSISTDCRQSGWQIISLLYNVRLERPDFNFERNQKRS